MNELFSAESIPNWIAAISAIATLVAVLEMKRQRKLSIMPELAFLHEVRFKVFKETDVYDLDWSNWTEHELDFSNNVTFVKTLFYEIDCYNLGLGHARNVKIDFDFDCQRIKSFLQELKSIEIDILKLDNETSTLGGLYLKKQIGISSTTRNNLNLKIPFIISSEKVPVKIKLPDIYLYLFSLFISSTLAEKENEILNRKFPPLKMKMTYADITQMEYKKNYEISFSIDSYVISYQTHPANKSYLSGLLSIIPVD